MTTSTLNPNMLAAFRRTVVKMSVPWLRWGVRMKRSTFSVGRCMQALVSLLSKAQHCFSTVVVPPQLHGLTGIVGRKYSAVNPYHTAKINYKVVCEGGGQQDINQSTREFG